MESEYLYCCDALQHPDYLRWTFAGSFEKINKFDGLELSVDYFYHNKVLFMMKY